jgi:phenylacetate-CoA ligase
MTAIHTQAPNLDPIEHASRDEISALQLERLKKTVQHAYDNVQHHRNAFDKKGVHPSDLDRKSVV